MTSRQLLQLAEATPAEKFGWRPAAGVRSISEVYMHLALGNYYLLERAGAKTGVDLAKLGKLDEVRESGRQGRSPRPPRSAHTHRQQRPRRRRGRLSAGAA